MENKKEGSTELDISKSSSSSVSEKEYQSEGAQLFSDLEKEVSKNGWSRRTNRLLFIWLDRTLKTLQEHYKRYSKLKFLNSLLGILSIVFGVGATSLSFFNVGLLSDLYISYIMNVVIGISAACAAVLSGIINFFKLEEQIQSEKYSITRFSRLRRLLEVAIMSAIDERDNASDFFKMVSEKYYKYHASSGIMREELSDIRKVILKKNTHSLHSTKHKGEEESINTIYDGSKYVSLLKQIAKSCDSPSKVCLQQTPTKVKVNSNERQKKDFKLQEEFNKSSNLVEVVIDKMISKEHSNDKTNIANHNNIVGAPKDESHESPSPPVYHHENSNLEKIKQQTVENCYNNYETNLTKLHKND